MFAVLIRWPLFVMDRGQSLIILPLFDGTNYAFWKVCMRAFLQSSDEKVWQAVEIGWTKPTKVPVDWDDAKIKVANFNSRALNAYTVQSPMRSSRKYPLLKLLKRHGPSSRQPMREPRLSRIQSYRGSLQASKRLRWRRMSRLTSSMSSSRT